MLDLKPMTSETKENAMSWIRLAWRYIVDRPLV